MISIYKVEGHSMEPELKAGDRVLTLRCTYLFSKPKKGDIIVFKTDNESRVYIKRISNIVENTIKVQGDNKNDSLKIKAVNKRDILGKVILKY